MLYICVLLIQVRQVFLAFDLKKKVGNYFSSIFSFTLSMFSAESSKNLNYLCIGKRGNSEKNLKDFNIKKTIYTTADNLFSYRKVNYYLEF